MKERDIEKVVPEGAPQIFSFVAIIVLPAVLIWLGFLGYKSCADPDPVATLIQTPTAEITISKTVLSTATRNQTITQTQQKLLPNKTPDVQTQTVVNTVDKKTSTKKAQSKTLKTTSTTKKDKNKPIAVDYSYLLISADKTAKVYINGKLQGNVPVRYKVTAFGKKYNIQIIHTAAETKKISITPKKGKQHTYVWSFFNNKASRSEVTNISK